MSPDPDALLALSPAIRYVATLIDGRLLAVQRSGLAQASDSGSDRYEELLVNPTLLTMVSQRGNIDCGGVRGILVRYGHFTQFVAALPRGHLSIAIEPEASAATIADAVLGELHGMLEGKRDGGP